MLCLDLHKKNQLVKALRETDNLSKATSLEDFNRLLTESGNVDDVVFKFTKQIKITIRSR